MSRVMLVRIAAWVSGISITLIGMWRSSILANVLSVKLVDCSLRKRRHTTSMWRNSIPPKGKGSWRRVSVWRIQRLSKILSPRLAWKTWGMRIFMIVVAVILKKIVPRVKSCSTDAIMMHAFLLSNGLVTLKGIWTVFTTTKRVNNDWNTFRVKNNRYTLHKKSFLVTSLRFTTTSSFLFCSLFRFNSYFFLLIMRKRLSWSDSSLWFG